MPFVRKERTYYKYEYQDFVQPILTADGTLGGKSFAVTASSISSASYPAYQAFDVNTSDTVWLCSGNGSLIFYNPNALKVSQLTIQNRSHPSYIITAGTIEASNDNATWTTLTSFTNSNTGANAEWNIDLSSNTSYYKYYKINATAHTNEYTGIRNVTITAQEQIAVQVNLGGEDVYEDWKQPVLTANGTMGGDKFAVTSSEHSSSYQPFYVFDADTTNEWEPVEGGIPAFISFYNPNKLKISKLTITNGNQSYIVAATLQGSDDNIKWVDIKSISNNIGTLQEWSVNVSSNTGYKYHRLYITETSNGSYCDIRAITITAQELKAVGSNDYDYYVNHNKLYQLATVKRSYWKYQDWAQPVLNANGIMGGDSFAVAASSVLEGASNHQPYTSFNEGEISTDYWHSTSGHPSYIEWYNPNPLLITNIKVTNRHSGGAHINSYIVSYSDNYSAWTQVISGTSPNQVDYGEWNIVITESKPHKYWRLTSVSSSGSNSSYTAVGKIDITAQELVKVGSTDYDYYTDKLLSYAPIVRGKRSYYKQADKQRDTGTYTFTLDKEYTAKMLFVGNGGGGCSSQKDSRWHVSSGGSGACFEGTVRLPADTYTLTIGSLGYGNNANNTHYHSSSVVSTDSYLTNSAGQELIRVGAGGNGYTSVGGVGGAAGVLTLGTLDILETKKATDGVYTAGNVSTGSLSAYDNTYTGYGAGTSGTHGQGNVYGIKGIFDLVLETDINDYTYYEDVGTKIY